MIYLLLIISVIYMVTVFSYTEAIFQIKANKKYEILGVALFNTLIFTVQPDTYSSLTEFIAMIIYITAITIEFLLIFKVSLKKVLFGSFSFAINFFAIRMIVVAVISLTNNISFNDIYASPNIMMLVNIINLSIPVPYIITVRKLFPNTTIVEYLENKDNTMFTIAISSLTYLNQMVNLLITDFNDLNDVQSLIIIRTSIFSILVFLLVLACIILFSNLENKVNLYRKISKAVSIDNSNIEKFAQDAIYDNLTKATGKQHIIQNMKSLLNSKDTLHIVYIKMTNLGKINKGFSREEGDEYLKLISNILIEEFFAENVGRVESNEFVILLKGKSSCEINSILKNTAKKIELLEVEYDKPYNTGIQYSITECDKSINMDAKGHLEKARKEYNQMKNTIS